MPDDPYVSANLPSSRVVLAPLWVRSRMEENGSWRIYAVAKETPDPTDQDFGKRPSRPREREHLMGVAYPRPVGGWIALRWRSGLEPWTHTDGEPRGFTLLSDLEDALLADWTAQDGRAAGG